jgi:hypothetical protein
MICFPSTGGDAERCGIRAMKSRFLARIRAEIRADAVTSLFLGRGTSTPPIDRRSAQFLNQSAHCRLQSYSRGTFSICPMFGPTLISTGMLGQPPHFGRSMTSRISRHT